VSGRVGLYFCLLVFNYFFVFLKICRGRNVAVGWLVGWLVGWWVGGWVGGLLLWKSKSLSILTLYFLRGDV
jgi:hypothetical protein